MHVASRLPALEELLEPVAAIARAASSKILEIYASDFTVAQKADQSPLTQADLAAHHTIVEGLSRLTPGTPVLSEESAGIPFSERSSWERYWLVDPLDGTKEFVKKNGEFTVNIALIEAHRPVLGVVVVPVTGHHYFAARGVGAFKRGNNSDALPLRTRRADRNRLTVSASRSHADATLHAFVDNLPGGVELISRGSSLKLCLVAEGLSDIYPRFGPTSEWDTAAAQCVVEQAGGHVFTLGFEPLAYNTKDDLLNPHFLAIGDAEFPWKSLLPASAGS